MLPRAQAHGLSDTRKYHPASAAPINAAKSISTRASVPESQNSNVHARMATANKTGFPIGTETRPQRK